MSFQTVAVQTGGAQTVVAQTGGAQIAVAQTVAILIGVAVKEKLLRIQKKEIQEHIASPGTFNSCHK